MPLQLQTPIKHDNLIEVFDTIYVEQNGDTSFLHDTPEFESNQKERKFSKDKRSFVRIIDDSLDHGHEFPMQYE